MKNSQISSELLTEYNTKGVWRNKTTQNAQKPIYKHKNLHYTRIRNKQGKENEKPRNHLLRKSRSSARKNSNSVGGTKIMTQLELTQDELEELISAEAHMYMDYDEDRSAQYNESIRKV